MYLTLEARENQLREDFRRRALSAAFVVFAAAAGTLALALTDAPLMGRGLTATPWAVPLHLTTGAAAVAAIYTLWKRRYVLAPVAAAVQVSLILWVGGWHSTHISFRLRLRLRTRLPQCHVDVDSLDTDWWSASAVSFAHLSVPDLQATAVRKFCVLRVSWKGLLPTPGDAASTACRNLGAVLCLVLTSLR